MKAIKTAFILVSFLFVSLFCSTATPSWTRDVKIDSGELKAVNYELFYVGNTGSVVNPNVTVTRFQHFNNTGFGSAPRIIFAMKSYGTRPTTSISSLTMGFRINIVTKNATNFTYTVSAFGATLIALHYQYFAVDGYANSLYLQIYTLNISNSSILLNDNSTSPRSENFALDNPGSVVVGDNFNSSQMLIQVWPIFFTFKAASNTLSIETIATISSKTQFSVTVIAKNGCLLNQLGISILYMNKTKLYEDSFYMLFVDYTTVNITGTNVVSPPTISTMDNTTTQYQFRNSEEGVKGFYLPFENVSSVTGWYIAGFKETTVLNYVSIQTRKRVCPANNTFFHVQNKYCMDVCPTPYFYTNTNYTFCKRCHYSCYTCNSDTSSSCSTCNTNSSRQLINNTCACINYYFDSGSQICGNCDYTCLTCISVSNNSCSSCNANASRLLVNNSCICKNRFFEKGVQNCNSCHYSCLTCYQASNDSCSSCSANLSRLLVNNSCVCENRFFDGGLQSCGSCHYSCLTCLSASNYSCSTCNTNKSRAIKNNSCICDNRFYDNGIQACSSCHYSCLTCFQSSNSSCNACSANVSRLLVNNSCICEDHFFDNGLQNCNSCHYSCMTCFQASNYSCSSCSLNSSRSILNSSCICDNRFFDNGQAVCGQCHSSCLTCSDSSQSGCLSCDNSANLTLINSSCTCNNGHYFNNTCLPCFNGCLSCSYDSALGSYQCLSCNASLGQVQNSSSQSCVCPFAYYNNNTFCTKCMQGCIQCSSASTCVICDLANNWQLDNSTNDCTCSIGYYSIFLNSTQTCTRCSLLGCLDCIFTTFLQCTLCDGMNNYQLSNGSCICKASYFLTNSTCTNNSSSLVCGNGIVQGSEECDDGNNLESDGCSSLCKIQPNHNCIINVTTSICFYNELISFIAKQIFKQPFQNRVTITLLVIAPNCNILLLKLYLESSPSIFVANAGRLLAASPQISSTSVSFSSQTNTLTVNFEYNSNIDLTSKMVTFVPSQDTTSGNKRYFFNSPSATLTLSPPTNLLLTTYSSPEDLSKTKAISSIFAALIGFSWLFWLISLCYNQTAPAVEYLLILQIAYQSLLQRKIITDGWVGLVLYGKYSYGYNVDYEIINLYDRMQILSLSTHLFHTLNITPIILGLVLLAILVVLIYQTVKIRTEEVYKSDLNSTQAKIQFKQSVSQRQKPQQQDQQGKYKILKGVVLFLFQIATSLSLLTVKITVITVMLAQAQVASQVAIIGAILLTCYIIIWILIYKFYDMQFFNDFSFKRVLRSPEEVNESTSLSIKCGNFIVKYYYLILFLLLTGFGVIAGSPQIGAPFYIVALIVSIFFIVAIILFGVYFRAKHLVRSCCNLLGLAVIFVLHLVETINTAEIQQNYTGPLICISVLILSFLINSGILLNIEFRRFKMNRKSKKSKKNQISPLPKIIIRNQTEEPQIQRSPVNVEIIMDRRMEQQQDNEVQVRRSEHSNQSLGKESKFQSIGSKSNRNSYPETQKKFIPQRKEEQYQQTKQKNRQNQFEKFESILKNVPQTYVRREKIQNEPPNQAFSQSSQVERIEVVDISRSFSDLAKTKQNFKPSNIAEIPQTTYKNYGIIEFQQ